MRKTYAVLLLGLSVGVLAAPAGEKGKPLVQSNDEAKVFQLTNQERAQEKVGPLKLSRPLQDRPLTPKTWPAKRRWTTSSTTTLPATASVKEVIATRPSGRISRPAPGASLENIMKAWMASKGHRANILEDDYTETGVGTRTTKKAACTSRRSSPGRSRNSDAQG